MMTTTKASLHRLVDELPERELATAERFLAYLRDTYDPVLRSLEDAPEDDEPLTREDEAAIEEGRAAYRRGETVTLGEYMQQRGL